MQAGTQAARERTSGQGHAATFVVRLAGITHDLELAAIVADARDEEVPHRRRLELGSELQQELLPRDQVRHAELADLRGVHVGSGARS